MTREEIIQIWERGNHEEIKELHDCLQNEEGAFRVIRRRPESLERYFRTHSNGYTFHPIQYEWDGKVWVLEILEKKLIIQGRVKND